jgi:hypothetical protein
MTSSTTPISIPSWARLKCQAALTKISKTADGARLSQARASLN